MLKAGRSHGFTVLEVTIAITLITAGMVLAMMAINNRLRQENFQRGASIFGSVVDDILNDVSTNNWPTVSDWACQLDPATRDVDFVSIPGHETGEGECLYVGKVIQFGDERLHNEEDNTYIVHTIITHRSALIPIYDFDPIVRLSNPADRLHPLGVVEKEDPLNPGAFLFSTRGTKSWPHGMHVSQVYYDDNEDNNINTQPGDKVFLRGLAVVQQAGHGLKENDLLLTISGGSQVGIRVVHDKDTTPTGARNPHSPRLDADDFADSLKRTPGRNRSNESGIEHNFKLPIYICLSDGRGNKVLVTLGGNFGSLLVENEFDETRIQRHCG